MFTRHYLDDVFNSFLQLRPSVYVVSETTMKEYQERQKKKTLTAIDKQIEALQDYRKEVEEYYDASLKLDYKEEKEPQKGAA